MSWKKLLVNKTIESVSITGIKGCDDKPYLNINLTDGTKVRVVADYGGYTAVSDGEYPRYIKVDKIK